MKTLIIALTAFFAMCTTLSAQTTPTTTSKKEVHKATYSCPMHPEVTSLEKGKCSKCGMELVKTTPSEPNTATKEKPTSSTNKNKYICTMDGFTSNKPGKCPKCGMALVEKKETKKNNNHNH